MGKPDLVLLGTIFVILIFGLVMLTSASSIKSYREFNSTYYLFFHQIIFGLLPGTILFFWLSRVSYHLWEKYSVLFFILSLIILGLVFIPGLSLEIGETKSWLKIFGASVQPSEIIKLFLILSLAGWFSYRGREKNQDFWNGLIPFVFILGLISLPIALQPDLGTLVVVAVIALSIYFVAGAKISHLLGLAAVGLGLFGILIFQTPYRAERLMTFLNPELDPQGIGYQINQALLAVGSGGFFGLGFGQSRQKFAYLPEVIGDSIFAIIAEELGFIISLSLIFLLVFFAYRGLKLARGINDEYGKLIVTGIIAWFIFQSFFNIAVMIGLMPLTGIPLPFVSYGGTALATLLAATGILANISRQAS
ncbi:MAG: cell division protein FtsW [Candidatus Buchananbacteria bacterium RIFCSPHIGHO2_01_FULL_39_14]|uniref:Probable peptidoglycan glycosyltransferase FtsW n=2 Tax=Candidatus Buchananiibacteriota TaxID=1817903 RepID=A0A1G1YPX6_9BACT|nr:MAG: cell division protein FtsW [Candidatus Buchananbacteria bacterium RIFCSPHIGHO2_01_FULL_39_14]OGY49281.1 MAG: cell division protein FtsW [Candidatus Buchananbacteria bacterium RIFCSPHIGHO2_02_FULL_39_17]OGY54339.1 MAG: cell division protein FtsW [Candidatus Buchananbacteria bacterium RIFCSPLOWO2_01_FULL_40_23b]